MSVTSSTKGSRYERNVFRYGPGMIVTLVKMGSLSEITVKDSPQESQ